MESKSEMAYVNEHATLETLRRFFDADDFDRVEDIALSVLSYKDLSPQTKAEVLNILAGAYVGTDRNDLAEVTFVNALKAFAEIEHDPITVYNISRNLEQVRELMASAKHDGKDKSSD